MRRQITVHGKNEGVTTDFWTRDLSHISSSYGRLVYLSRLRNPDTGKYEHYGSDPSTRALASRLLKRLHEDIFNEWVSYTLERKMADVEVYIAAIDQVNKTDLIDAWLRLTPY